VSAPQPASHKSKKAQADSAAAANKAAAAAAAADVISINIPSLPGKEITIGPARHRICEPLLRGKTKGGETVWEGMGRALDGPTVSVAERMLAWEAVGVIGEVSRIKCKCMRVMSQPRARYLKAKRIDESS
jgi:actin-related protein 9